MLRVSNIVERDFSCGMTQIGWRARMVGSARCADRTPQRGVPTVEILGFAQNDLRGVLNSVDAARNPIIGLSGIWKR